MQPRVVRLKYAPTYLGMDKNRFNTEVRPLLHEKKRKRAVEFDRLELDAWADEYFYGNGRSKEDKWNDRNSQKVSSGVKNQVVGITRTSTLKNSTDTTSFADRAKQVIQKKQRKG